MFVNYSLESWRAWVRQQPVDQASKELLMYRISSQINSSVPVILEFEQLCNVIGFPQEALAGMVNRSSFFYHEFCIPKNSGGYRRICAPKPSLLYAQRLIANNILGQAKVSDHAFGFVAGKSVRDNAERHLGTQCTLKTDISDFFPSITIPRVVSVFKNFGYSSQVSYYLASLCCFRGSLPQGAATSPILSNIIAKRLDSRMSGLADKYGLIYTRYADDIAFSGQKLSWKFASIVGNILKDEGFKINLDKTILVSEPSRRVVTGISINGGRLKLPRDKKRWIKKQMYHISKNGIIEHMRYEGIYDILYIDRLKGYLEFLRFVEGDSEMIRKYMHVLHSEEQRLETLVG